MLQNIFIDIFKELLNKGYITNSEFNALMIKMQEETIK